MAGRIAVTSLAVTLLGSVSLFAQSTSVDPFLRWLDLRAQQHLDQREAAVAAIQSEEAANRRKLLVHRKLLDSIGGLVDFNGPLHARVTGILHHEGYAVEKVIFESLPGFYVTGNLYRPSRAGRYPGVLLPAGHTQEGKPENQVIAANLARKGFIAFSYDPIGQGEREQSYLTQLGRPLSGGGGNEHLELGARSLLIGQSVAKYFIFDAKRSVDYLVSRSDVDADHIGVVGCSGGGAIAAYAAAFDSRIQAAAAGCFLNSFRTLFTGPTADSEMTFPSILSNGLDWADFFELRAPLPWLLMATTGDYFRPDGARPVYEEARRWYRLYRAEDNIRFFVGEGPHGTPRESREEIYRWMNRWLKNQPGDWHDEPVELYTNRELLVTASGHVDDEPRSRKLHQILWEEFKQKHRPGTVADLKVELERLGLGRGKQVTPKVQVIEGRVEPGLEIQEVAFESAPGLFIGGTLYLPTYPGPKPAAIIVREERLPVPLFVQRSQSTGPLAENIARRGVIVLELDPRDSRAALDGRPFLGNWLTAERVNLIGENLPVMRAQDISVAVSVLSARADVDATSIRGYARGVKGFWLLLAAAADDRLAKIWLDRTPWSFALALEAPLASFLFDALIPGFALRWDIQDLADATGRHRILWSDPANWMNQVVDRGKQYRYRYVGQNDDSGISEFIR